MAKRANGKCYHCTEKYVAGHHCVNKGVYIIELVDDEDEDAVLDEVGILLHALTGINVADTMNLPVVIAGAPLTALVDTGSTHTFIRDSVARKIGLPSRWPTVTGSRERRSASTRRSTSATRSSASTATHYHL